jgi:hypothetical protein
MCKQKELILAGTIFMAITLIMFLPAVSVAGNLEPSGPPAPTMKTLDQMPPTWDQTLQCDTTACPRFVLVMGGAGVLDKETGLVWEKSPSTTAVSLSDAQVRCNLLTAGGRLGWRLPSVQDLASLVDPTVPAPGPKLPSGHPFTSVLAGNDDFYWSANCNVSNGCNSYEWAVGFGVNIGGYSQIPGYMRYVWCVRGGQGVDAQ